MLPQPNQNVICISSTVSGEGKTFCAVNLAIIMALAGKKTLLVSLDLRRPKVHRVFHIKNQVGLSTYLVNQSNEKEIVTATNVENLFVANAGPIPPNPAELIGSEKMIKYIDMVKKEYDYVIIDTPPVAIVTDALLLKNIVDVYVFVIRHNYSTKQVLQLVDDLFNKRDMKNLSLLVNDVQVKGYYGYSYSYGYSYGYGYGYNYYGKGYYEDEEVKENLGTKIETFIRKLLKY
ncbi:MAG: CpsD/CapB family tyrosine-protein kinase [Bacteroidales bacterium]|nr:CpsD/CapB family tyrosine-protein kinase [Bacteroidales bacterium]